MSVTYAVTFELKIDGAWVDFTRRDVDTRVMLPISYTWGRTKPGQRTAPSVVSFVMIDNNCVVDGDNPLSPYYRKIDTGTEARISIGGVVRMSGRLTTADVEPIYDDATDRWVNFRNVQIGGLLRDLDAPQLPVRSAAYAAFSDPVNDGTRVFYAPLEEESGAATLATFNRVGQIIPSNDVNFGGDTDSLSSARLLTFGTDGLLEAYIPPYSSTEHKVCMLWKFPSSGLTNGTAPIRLRCSGGNVDRIQLQYNTPWTLRLQAVASSTVIDEAVIVDWTGYIDNNQEFWMSIELTQNGANVDCLVGIIREDGTFGIPTDTLNGVTIGRISRLSFTPEPASGVALGHVIIGTDTGAFANYLQFVSNAANGVNGYRSELADARLLRLFTAAGITYGNTQSTLADDTQMGSQEPKMLGDLIWETVDTDGGILFEHKPFLAAVLASRFALYNQARAAALEWRHLTLPFAPSPVDIDLFNDMTVSNEGGRSARYTIPDGDPWHRTTEPPPDGVGLRSGRADVNLYPDDDLDLHAAWQAHVYSWRERQFNQVTLDLHRSDFGAADIAAVRALRPGHVINIDTTNAPPYVPYNEIRLMVQGATEEITQHTHRIVLNTIPADIFEVATVDAEGSYLAQPIDSDDTTFKISPPSKGPAWSMSGGDLPYNIQIAGQPMRVTAIAESIPGYISAGAIATGSNASLNPALPVGPFQDSGDSFWLWASIRNSGAGAVNDIPNWTRIADFGNCALFACHYTSSPSIGVPTVSFSGGVANATTMAQIFAFSNVSLHLASGTKGVPAAHTQLNASAQNIGYPAVTVNSRGEACVNMIFAWKQDDFTSIAPPSGYTEISDSFTTTGDDAGIWVGYDLTAASGAAGSLVVTGGASAISRAVVVSVRPLQSITVTRNIAGVASGANVGAVVRTWRPGVNGL